MVLSSSVRAALFAAFGVLSLPAVAVETTPEPEAPVGQLRTATRQLEPEVNAASDEPELSRQGFKLADGFQAKLWAAEPLLANPVAFTFDERGRMFVAETYRYRTSVLDIRDYLWSLEDDMAARTIEDRLAYIRKNFGAEGEQALSQETEQVRLVEDTNGDGVADRSSVFADGFRSPLDGIAAGVLARRGSVWFTNIPSLWRFDGITPEGKAAHRTELARGFGVRFGFTGHDLHGLAWGPDGKIYFSIGDRGAHVPTKEGGAVSVPDTGAVFRCNPDGTALELVMSGLRNPQELIFTENGDLFTGDNDCDAGDMERLVHVVEGGDAGWTVGFQHAPLGKAGPWNLEKLWVPRFPEQAAYIIPPLCNIEDGPSGVAYYPGTGLTSEYAGHFFICHFKGSITRSGIHTYTLQPAGASYTVATSKPFLRNALPTDVDFGPDGRLYWTDWADGWPKSKRGRVFAVSPVTPKEDALAKETHALITSDFSRKSPDELALLLGHADRRVRLEAQFTLAEQGRSSLALLTKVAAASDGKPLARLHAVWALGQLAGAKDSDALATIRQLVLDPDAEIRAQAVKLLGDHGFSEAFAALVTHLRDESPRVRYFAAQSLGKLGWPEGTGPLLQLLRENDDRDLYLRHAAVVALARLNHLAALESAANSLLRAERLGALLVHRRLGRAEVARFLNDPDPLLVVEAARAINDAPINDALPALASLIDKPIPAAERLNAKAVSISSRDEATLHELLMLRVLNANFRLGGPEQAAALASYAARADAPAKLRGEALAQLALWAKPPARDRIVGVYRPLASDTRDGAVAAHAITAALPSLLAATSPEAVQLAAIEVIEKLEIRSAADALFAVVGDGAMAAEVRTAALDVLDAFKHPRLAEAVKTAGASGSSTLRLAALPIAARLAPDDAAPVVSHLVEHGSVTEQKAALGALGDLKHANADKLILKQFKLLASGQLAPAVEQELIEAAEKRADPAIKELLAHRAAMAEASGPLAKYHATLAGGTSTKGRKLFNEHPVLACVRCHQVGGEGGEAGPDLSTIGQKYTRDYLLEAVVKPSARIAPGFETAVVSLKSGAVQSGTVSGESESTLSLRLADNTTVEIAKGDIAKRETAPSSMPEIYGQILTPAELRDLIEYLAGLNVKPGSDPSPRALRNVLADTP